MNRLTTYPIRDQTSWELYITAQQSIWTPPEIPFHEDKAHFIRLHTNIQEFIENILAFFAAFDSIVNTNIVESFKKEALTLEMGYFYDMQVAIENIHAETYSIMLTEIVSDLERQEALLRGVYDIPEIVSMAEFARRSADESLPFTTRLFYQACVEGVMFPDKFCVIYWLQSLNVMPGLTLSNEWIARDEGLHTRFAVHLIKYFGGISRDVALPILVEACDLTKRFMNASLKIDVAEMNKRMICEYIEYIGDNLLAMCGLEIHFKTMQPFPFMQQLGMKNKSDFFIKRVTEYAKPQKSTGGINYDF